MHPLPHGYTNQTCGDGATVVKRYQGPGARARSEREQAILRALQGQLPVPGVVSYRAGRLTMAFRQGVHGQELLAADRADGVLRACGRMLRRIHQLDPSHWAAAVTGSAGDGRVLVHGDYGPQNVLLDPAALQITAVLDWEWAHAGDPIEDLAWCEWIIRMHHPGAAKLLGSFFDAYGGSIPPWPARHGFMRDRCRSLRDFCRRQSRPVRARRSGRIGLTSRCHGRRSDQRVG